MYVRLHVSHLYFKGFRISVEDYGFSQNCTRVRKPFLENYVKTCHFPVLMPTYAAMPNYIL